MARGSFLDAASAFCREIRDDFGNFQYFIVPWYVSERFVGKTPSLVPIAAFPAGSTRRQTLCDRLLQYIAYLPLARLLVPCSLQVLLTRGVCSHGVSHSHCLLPST